MKPLNWTPLTLYSTFNGDAWFSGRVTDLLLNDEIILVASSHGGVWRIDTSSNVLLTGFDSRCLTDDWDDPKVNSLAHGPDNDQQIYAGCENTLRYFELNSDNLIATSVLLSLPVSNLKIVYRILIQKETRRIILATGKGLWWSDIPTSPANANAYSWNKAGGLPGDVISGLCHASNNAIHAGILGNGSATGDNYGIFKGVFQNGNFNFTRSKIKWNDGLDKHDMQRVSLASCANNRSVAFASASKVPPPADTGKPPDFRGVLQYHEAQDQWEEILSQKNFDDAGRPGEPGGQGTFNNTIAVAPDDASLVALGWQMGTYIFNPSHIFKQPGNKLDVTLLNDAKCHHDIHHLHFTKSENGKHTLYIGSDGGLLKVSGPTRTHPSFDDRLNVFLPTLLFKDELRAKQYATMDASPFVDGLIAGGLQDNGCKWLKTAKGKYTFWQKMVGGDGGTNTFLANGILISRMSNSSGEFLSYVWNATSNSFDGGSEIPLSVKIETDPKQEVCTRIPTPAFRNKDQLLMHAISAAVQKKDGGTTKKGDNLLLGLFEDAAGSTHFHWEIIGVFGNLIKAAASRDGNSIFVSTENGKIHSVNSQKFLAGQDDYKTDLPLPAPLQSVNGSVIQFELTKGPVFALFVESGGAKKGHILVLDNNGWKEILTPVAETIYSIAADWDLEPAPLPLINEEKRLFFTTDNAVYQGVQSKGPQLPGFQTSFNWQKGTNMLPARPHCTHLRLGWDDQKLFLYLSTYGRSVYRAELRQLVQLPGH